MLLLDLCLSRSMTPAKGSVLDNNNFKRQGKHVKRCPCQRSFTRQNSKLAGPGQASSSADMLDSFVVPEATSEAVQQKNCGAAVSSAQNKI